MMKIRFVAMLAYAVLLCLPASAGSFKSNKTGDQLIFTGNIAPGDDSKLVNLLRSKTYYGILLETNGGDVTTALSMGRALRDKRMSATVLPNSFCRSACVFLLAGAVERNVYGEVAIHRPYYSELSPDLTSDEVQKAYTNFTQQITAYLTEMNIPAALADAMFATRPEARRVLSERELSSFMLNQTDPVYDEITTASMASSYRLSSAEFRRRDAISRAKCGKMIENSPRAVDFLYEDYEVCLLSIMANLPLGVAQTRYQTYKRLYKAGADDDSDVIACMTAVYLDGATTCPRLRY